MLFFCLPFSSPTSESSPETGETDTVFQDLLSPQMLEHLNRPITADRHTDKTQATLCEIEDRIDNLHQKNTAFIGKICAIEKICGIDLRNEQKLRAISDKFDQNLTTIRILKEIQARKQRKLDEHKNVCNCRKMTDV